MLRHIVDRGGITVYTDNVLRSIIRLDERNRYVLLLPGEEHRERYPSSARVTSIVLPFGGGQISRWVWDQHKVLTALKPHDVDVIYNPKLSVPLRAGCKTVFTMHGLEQFAAKQYFAPYDRAYFTVAMQLYCRKADGILVMTQTGKMDLQKYLGVPPEKIHVVPESYNERCHVVEERGELDQVRAKLQLPDRFILFVGGITPLKNIPTLLRAFTTLKARHVPHKLVLAGFKRWRFAKELTWIEKLGIRDDVVEPGFVEDTELPALYTLADCLVLPSFYEGFGLPILEAQACGCPVVISRRGAMPEVAGEGAALLFDPASPEELADRIGQILQDASLRGSLVGRGLENVKKYAWTRTALQTIRLFESLAATR